MSCKILQLKELALKYCKIVTYIDFQVRNEATNAGGKATALLTSQMTSHRLLL